jgi:acetyl-CoA carboxylase carboxyl transferase subunit alpha
MDILPHEKQIQEYEKTILQLKSSKNELFSLEEVAVLEKKLKELKERIYERLDPWERVQICRHPMRPHTVDYN